MSNPSVHGAIEIEAETDFAEDVQTFATYRPPTIVTVDCSGLKKPRMPNGRVLQHRNAGAAHLRGVYSGTFTVRVHNFGLGSSTAGATATNAHTTWLGNTLGNVAASATSGTTFTGGTASVPTTTASGTFAAGSIGFAGALDDGRGGGQAFAVSGHSSNNLTLLTELDAAPNNTDVCRSAVMVYPSEDPTDTEVTTYRIRAITANLAYEMHGCHPTAWVYGGTNAGESPYIEITYAVAWFEESATTLPSAVATNTSLPSPIAGGSLFVQLVGTDDRQTFVHRNFTVEHTLGMRTDRGPGGVKADQDIVGCRRMPDTIKISFTVDADANTASPVLKGIFNGAACHILWTGSTTDGSAIALYAPNCEPCEDMPVQKIDENVNRYSISFYAYTGATTTNDLTASAIRYAFA